MRIIISETQLERLKTRLNEVSTHSTIVGRIKTDLNGGYVPVDKVLRKGGEYMDAKMIMNKTDEELITPKDLYEYLKTRYKFSDEFLKQVIRDWVYNKITDDNTLSKNVPVN